jgi:cation transport ATPase
LSNKWRFDYVPGGGITAVVDVATILVGNRALMTERDVAVSENMAAGVDRSTR